MHSTGTTVLILVVYVLASMRVTRLINADTITSLIRLYPASKVREYTLATNEARAHGRTNEFLLYGKRRDRWASIFEFIQCPWCVGWWVPLGGGVLAVWVIKYEWTFDWWALVPIALAASHLIGVCARFADTEEIEIQDA